MWAYQLAVVVDDAKMGITHIVRGEDLRGSTPRQIALQQALGAPTPSYLHVPLLRGPDGHKLSKRHGARDLGELRAAGVRASTLVLALAQSAGVTAGWAAAELEALASAGEPGPLLMALLRTFDASSIGERPSTALLRLLAPPGP
jgi:glutamyl/glutaminyl-tRNA synthetase